MANRRIYYFDVLNVISCFSVIALHCNGHVHSFDVADDGWWLHVLFEVAFFNAVPTFFMLSGATLLGYRRRYDTVTFFKRRCRKAFLPFLFWATVFFVLSVVTGWTELTPRAVAQAVLSCRIHYTDYWFFVPLFLLYLFMPFLSVMVAHLKEKEVLILAMLIIGIQAVVNPVGQRVGAPWELPIGGYVAYALLGYYLANTSWEKNKRVVLVITALALFFMATRYVCVLFSDAKSSVMFSYQSLYAYFGSAAIFLIVKRKCTCAGGGISFLAGASFGVYLLQRLFVDGARLLIAKVTGVDDYHLCGWMLVLMTFVVYFSTVLIVRLLQRIPFVRHTVP